jgi:hypothetical protein
VIHLAQDATLTLKLALCVALSLASMPLFSPPLRKRFASCRSLWPFVSLFLASRALLFIATYVVLAPSGKGSDLTLYYYPQALQVSGGGVPYRDFPTSYGPFFPYVAASLFFISRSEGSVAAVMILFELASLLVFARILNCDADLREQGVANLVVCAYTINPVSAYWAGVTAYNGTIILFLWIIAVGLLMRSRAVLSVVVAACSVLACKLLGLLALPALVASRRVRFWQVCAGLAVPVTVLLALALFGLDVLLPVKREAARVTSANLWFLLSGILPRSSAPGLWRWGPFAAFGVAVTALARYAYRTTGEALDLTRILALLCGVNLVFLLLSAKSLPFYLLMFTLFLCYIAVRHARHASTSVPFAVLMILGTLSIVEPPMWLRVGQTPDLGAALRDPDTRSAAWRLLVTDAAMVFCYVYYLVLSVRMTRPIAARASSTPRSHSNPT